MASRASSAVAIPLIQTCISGWHCCLSQAMSVDQLRVGLGAWVWNEMGPLGGVWVLLLLLLLVLELFFSFWSEVVDGVPSMTVFAAAESESSVKLAIL